MITVTLEPENKTIEMPKANTVLQLFNRLQLRPGQALVIRNGKLLTPDVRLEYGDAVTVRTVVSRG